MKKVMFTWENGEPITMLPAEALSLDSFKKFAFCIAVSPKSIC